MALAASIRKSIADTILESDSMTESISLTCPDMCFTDSSGWGTGATGGGVISGALGVAGGDCVGGNGGVDGNSDGGACNISVSFDNCLRRVFRCPVAINVLKIHRSRDVRSFLFSV